jgi:hypothetical protein
MVLETLDKSRIDITELSVDQPETNAGRPFDAETELDPTSAGEFIVKFNKLCNEQQYEMLARHASSFRLLFPERFNELKLDGILEFEKSRVKEEDFDKIVNVTVNISKIKELFPDRPDAIEETLERCGFNIEGLKYEILDQLSKKQNFTEIQMFWLARDFKLIFPESDLFQELNDHHLSRAGDELREHFLAHLEGLREQGRAGKLIQYLVGYKVIWLPNAENNFNLTPAEWKSLRKDLEFYRHQDPDIVSYIDLAADMKIAAARKIELTEHGMELTMPEPPSLAAPTPEMPKERDF